MKTAYDYIIVGAGTAGCLLALRLSEDPQVTVCLVEAGGRRLNPWLHVPVGYFRTVGNPETDWCYQTEPEAGLEDRRIAWPRGRVFGGSGSINGLVYMRGQAADYDDWATNGCPGWSWEELLPYFRRSVDQERGADHWHGVGGPLGVSNDRTNFEICHRFVDAARELGLPAQEDCNRGDPYGVGYYQLTTRRGFRASTAEGLRRLARGRRNLTVKLNTQVHGIELEKQRAIGIRTYSRNGQARMLRATSEVILSAGAIASPQLLMLSGIGPAGALRGHGIDVAVDHPGVGQNLQDHLKIHNVYRTRIPTLNDRLNRLGGRIGMGLEYLTRRRGPLTMGAAPVFCFAESSVASGRPDVQFHVLPWSALDPARGIMHPFSGFTPSLCPVKPESRGQITLASANPSDPPRIEANYLATARDRQTAVAALRLSREICAQPALASVIDSEVLPGAPAQSHDAILAYVRSHASTVFHPVGTCRMGVDQDAVVDPQLRVRGIQGLRVVDASIMPSITSGNTNGPVAAIAEKAADLIRRDER